MAGHGPPPEGDPQQCTATANSTGKRCRAWAIRGANVCMRHGARAPQVRKAAARRLELIEAERQVKLYGLPVEVDPHTALLDELWRTAGHVAWLRERIAEVEEANKLYGPVGGQGGGHPSMEPHVWIRLYQEERRHLSLVAQACIKAGIEERRVRIAEAQGQLIATVIRGILMDLGVHSRPEVPTIVRRHLALAAGSPD